MALRSIKPPHETRTRILDAAEELFMQHGFEGTSMRLLTAKAGANLAAVNYHFGSKDDVVAEAFEALSREDLRELEEIARRPEPPPLRLAAYLDSSEWADRASWRV